MPNLINVEKKEQIAKEIKRLVEELNIQIHLANDIFLNVRISQNSLFLFTNNSDVSCGVSETVSY